MRLSQVLIKLKTTFDTFFQMVQNIANTKIRRLVKYENFHGKITKFYMIRGNLYGEKIYSKHLNKLYFEQYKVSIFFIKTSKVK